MADKIPIRGGFNGASLTGLAQFASGDTLGVAHGGTGVVTIGSNALVTGNGTSAMTSESNLTFDGTILKSTGDLCATVKVVAPALCIGSEYVLPTADGSAGQLMCTDGSGALAFATAPSSGISFNGSTANGVATYSSSTVADVESMLTFASPVLTIGASSTAELRLQGHGTNDVKGISIYAGGDFPVLEQYTLGLNWSGGTIEYDALNTFDHAFQIAGTTKLIITSGGKVGIGTTAPDSPLHVFTASAGAASPASNADDLVVENSAAGGISILTPDANDGILKFGSPTLDYNGSISVNHNSNAPYMDFNVDSARRMRITDVGKVGIGTAAPATLLDVNIGASNDDNLTLSSTGGYNPKLVFIDSNNSISAGIEMDSGACAMRFFNNSMTTERMTIREGNVGVGTSAPTTGHGSPALHLYKTSGCCQTVLTPCILNFCNINCACASAALGGIHFGGRDDAGNGHTYACIIGCIVSPSNNSETAAIRMGIMNVHTPCYPMTFFPTCSAGIGCLYTSHCLCVAVCIGAPTKNFEIEHPLASDESPNKYNQQRLIHSTLEGPEYGVYYRGTGQLDNGAAQIDLPEYFEALADKESATIQFTPVFGLSNLTIKSNDDCAIIYNNKFCVCTDASGNQNQCFHWFVQGRRIDKHIVCTIAQGDRPGACDDGRLCVERWQYREELVDNLNSEGLESMTCAELDDFISFNNTWDNDDPVFLSDYENVSKANKILMIGTAVGAVREPASHEEMNKTEEG